MSLTGAGPARARPRAVLLAAAVAALLAPTLLQAAPSSTGSVTRAAGTRGYELYGPDAPRPGEPRPLLVALHGCLQTAEQFAGLTRLNELADREGIFVLYPVQSAAANPARCWNWFDPTNQARGEGEPSLIKAMVDEVLVRQRIDPARIYVTGLSAGGYMTSILLACYPDLFVAGAVVLGGMYKAAESLAEGMSVPRAGSPHDPHQRGAQAWKCSGAGAQKSYPLLAIDGDADPIVGIANGTQLVAQFAQTNDYADDGEDNDSIGGPGPAERSRPEGKLDYTCRGYGRENVLIRHCTVHGLGHAWSGGNPSFQYAEPRGPDVTAMLWSFLTGHSRPLAD